MRKRQAARPVLESMEHRLVLNASGAVAHAAEVAAAHIARVDARAAHLAAAHADRSEAMVPHHHATRTAHPVHHSGSATKSSTKSTSTISNFFKSVFPGL